MFEGFDGLASPALGTDLLNDGSYIGWQVGSAGGPAKTAGELGGSQWQSNQGTNNLNVFNLSSALTTIILGCRINIPAFRTQWLFSFFDTPGGGQITGGGNLHVGLAITAAGKLAVYRGGTNSSPTTGTLLATGTTQLAFGSYYYVELKATINSSTGSFTVNLNGHQEITASSQNTQTGTTASVSSVCFRWVGGDNLLIDDMYVSDNTGSAPYNGFLCDATNALRIETLFPTATTTTAFTPLSSTNLSQIQEVNSDNDTTYNSNTAAGIDEFTHGSLASTPVTIYAVNVMSKFRSDDVSNMTARTKLISNGTLANGATATATTTYQYVKDQYINDPNTSAAWASASAVNSTTIGYERVT